jgi:hypothetical protein
VLLALVASTATGTRFDAHKRKEMRAASEQVDSVENDRGGGTRGSWQTRDRDVPNISNQDLKALTLEISVVKNTSRCEAAHAQYKISPTTFLSRYYCPG